jgi:hypothetical protein
MSAITAHDQAPSARTATAASKQSFAGPPALAHPSAAATLRAHSVRVPRLNSPGLSRSWCLLTAPIAIPALVFGVGGIIMFALSNDQDRNTTQTTTTAAGKS